MQRLISNYNAGDLLGSPRQNKDEMQELKQYICSGNWQAILEYGLSLDDAERNVQMLLLSCVEVDTDLIGHNGCDLLGAERILHYEHRRQVTALLHYARIVCTRNYADLRCIEVGDDPFRQSALYHYLLHPDAGWEPLVAFFECFPPDYLDKYLRQLSRDCFFNGDFKILWKLQEHGWLRFDEAFFVRRLFTLYRTDNDHEADAFFLLSHPEALYKVFLQFHKYELPVLDRIKCSSLEYPNGLSIQAHVYWTEVFRILLQQDVIARRELTVPLLTSLLNNWKKPHLDWHIRLLELLQPDPELLIAHQSLLLLALRSEYSNVLSYAISALQQIHKEPGFDVDAFLMAAIPVLRKERAGKSVLAVLGIIDSLAAIYPHLHQRLSQDICIALVQPDLRIQARTARMLRKYALPGSLSAVVKPYLSLLQITVREMLTGEMSIVC